jgi:hypothetical protein
MKVNGSMTRQVEEECLDLLMEIFTLATGRIIELMAKVYFSKS